MKKIKYPLVLCFLCVLSGIVPGNAQGLPGNKVGDIYSESIKWLPFPAFPPEARLAVLVGEPQKTGPYVIRVRVPAGVILRPHI